jgi:hypothetical protein
MQQQTRSTLEREFIASCAYMDDALKAAWERQAAELAKQCGHDLAS